ncbi:MAG TPA: DEAD/DEAH box helicase [Nitriliruptoraceae bacterium]|nr:DEAD/DEAH box helicase [Nitriliruptoraceae bacterium]
MSTKPLFTDFGLDDDLTAALSERGIVHPFPIQELTLPLALKGHDIIGQARTGTGKTLGFGLPLLQRIDTSKAQTQALVIVPTRELCIQVADDLTVGAGRGITTIAVYGGVGYDEQIEALTTGVHVVIGTPGRTIDHLNRGNLDVSQIHTVVLDEADEMLDMGFLPDVERLLADVPEERQTLLFSATMPTEIVKLARRFMAKPTFMRADETLHETAPEVDQHFFLVHRMDKPRVLARLLQKPDRKGAFVFCRTKRMCDRLVQELDGLGVSAIAVHGDLRQASREKNLDRFRDGKADVLVATEVAARGLDVSNVTYVINYDCPDDEKMYLHRIGRTARAGESGVAVTFAEFNEVDRVNVIRKRVAAEEELVEVFSTSDELTELFDLPEETPWDALTATASGRSGSSSSSKGDRARKSSSGSTRSSRSSARSDQSGGRRPGGRNRRSKDTGTGSNSSRNTGAKSSGGRRDDKAKSGGGRRDDKATQEARSSGDGGGKSRASSSRSRTRTRSRTTTEAVVAEAVEARESDDASSGARGDTDGAQRDRSSDRPRSGDDSSRSDSADKKSGSGSGRKRARSRARRNRSSSSSSSARGQDTGGSGSDGGGSGSDRSGDTRSSSTSRAPSTSGGNSKGGSRSRARSGKSKSGGRDDSRTQGRSSSRGRASGGGTDGNGRSNGNGRSKGGSATQDTTTRGDDARGDGTPRPRRRVEVEHLP